VNGKLQSQSKAGFGQFPQRWGDGRALTWKWKGAFMKMKTRFLFGALLTSAALIGCDSGRTSSRGFRLPEGDVEKGKAAFVSLKCHTCHTVHKLELPKPDSTGSIHVLLGGETKRVRTYGELVTSIIHPSHRLSERFANEQMDGKLSPMPEFNEFMTVQQLIDLVAFLESRYQVLEPDLKYYP
jgi:hypothetical protein